MIQKWTQLIEKTHPNGEGDLVPGLAGRYPLLGEELPLLSPGESAPVAWRIRLALCSVWSDEQLRALTEDVEEIRLSVDAKALASHASFSSASVYLDDPEGSDLAWTLSERRTEAYPPLSGCRSSWRQGDRISVEQTIEPDSMLLRNIAVLNRLQAEHRDVERWVVRASVSATSEAEGLIHDTLGYLAGVLSGVQVLEIEQQANEGFDTLWARLNILRLLRWEAELANRGDVADGAGFFTALAALEPTTRST